jgi:hypothetical protein
MNGALTWIIIPVPRAFAEGRGAAVHESGNGTFETCRLAAIISACGGRTEVEF